MNAVIKLFKNRFARTIFFVSLLAFLFSTYLNWFTANCRNCNIILISVDTLRADHMGIYGYDKNTTPNIDKWAKNAIIYTNAYTIFPETYQSFYTLFTGRDDFVKDEYGTQKELDENPNIHEGGNIAEILKNEGFYTAAFITNPILGKIYSQFFMRGFDKYNFISLSGLLEDDASFQYDYQNSKKVTQDSVSWLQKNAKKKFFLWLHYTTPHRPYNPPLKYLCKIDKNCRDQKYNLLYEDTSPVSIFLKSCTQEESQRDIVEGSINLYDAEILSVDEQIGQIIETIKQQGLDKNTVVVFYGDHGEGFDHRIYGHSNSLYNSSIRIPLVISIPNKIGKHIVNNYIDNSEILSLLQTLISNISSKENGTSKNTSMFFARTSYKASDKLSVFNEDYKYIYSNARSCRYNNSIDELYNVKNDPKEEKNLAEKHPEIARKMKEILLKHIFINPIQYILPIEQFDQKDEQLKGLGY